MQRQDMSILHCPVQTTGLQEPGASLASQGPAEDASERHDIGQHTIWSDANTDKRQNLMSIYSRK